MRWVRMEPLSNSTVVKVKDPSGKVRKVHYIPNINGFGARAYVRVGVFRKIENVASGPHVIQNLVRRLEDKGWELVDQ